MKNKKEKKQKNIPRAVIIVIFSFVLGFFLIGLFASEPEKGSSLLSLGESGILSNNNQSCEGGVVIGTTKDNYEQFVEALVVDDRLGYSTMLGYGQLFLVDNCTPVRKVGGSFTMSEVKILGGEQVGASGWTAIEFAIEN